MYIFLKSCFFYFPFFLSLSFLFLSFLSTSLIFFPLPSSFFSSPVASPFLSSISSFLHLSPFACPQAMASRPRLLGDASSPMSTPRPRYHTGVVRGAVARAPSVPWHELGGTCGLHSGASSMHAKQRVDVIVMLQWYARDEGVLYHL
jgi:hypothetical protein